MTTVRILTVEKDPRDPNLGVPHAERIGECLQFAAEYVMTNGGVLVHGSIYREGVSVERIGHAWVRTDDGGAFEPTLGVWWPSFDLYLDWANGIVDAIYSQEEAALNMLRSGHYGIWHPLGQATGKWGPDVGS